MRKFIFLCACAAALSTASPLGAKPHTYMPRGGYVPDAKTATRIAVAIWSPIYGDKHIQGKRPFKAKLNKGIWIIEGSFPKGQPGGVPVAEIAKKDGRILRVSHGK